MGRIREPYPDPGGDVWTDLWSPLESPSGAIAHPSARRRAGFLGPSSPGSVSPSLIRIPDYRINVASTHDPAAYLAPVTGSTWATRNGPSCLRSGSTAPRGQGWRRR